MLVARACARTCHERALDERHRLAATVNGPPLPLRLFLQRWQRWTQGGLSGVGLGARSRLRRDETVMIGDEDHTTTARFIALRFGCSLALFLDFAS